MRFGDSAMDRVLHYRETATALYPAQGILPLGVVGSYLACGKTTSKMAGHSALSCLKVAC